MTQDNPTLTEEELIGKLCDMCDSGYCHKEDPIFKQILTAVNEYPKLELYNDQLIKSNTFLGEQNQKLKAENEELKRKLQMAQHTKLQSIEEIDSQNRVFNENRKLQQENNQLRQLINEIPRIRKELDSIPVEDLLTDHCLTIDSATDYLFKIEKILKGDSNTPESITEGEREKDKTRHLASKRRFEDSLKTKGEKC